MARAVSEFDKASRRQALRDIAWQLFQEAAYEAISVQMIVDRAGLAKGTFYLYFATKEELFLSVQEQQFEEWFRTIDAQLEQLVAPAAPAAIAAIISSTLMEHPALIRLLAISHPVLEHNVGPESIQRLKQLLRDRVSRTGALIAARIPHLAVGDAARLLLYGYTLLIGIETLAQPPAPALAVIQDDPSLAMFQVDFMQAFNESFTTLLVGWLTQQHNNDARSKA